MRVLPPPSLFLPLVNWKVLSGHYPTCHTVVAMAAPASTMELSRSILPRPLGRCFPFPLTIDLQHGVERHRVGR